MRLQLHTTLAAACVLSSGYLYVAHRRTLLHRLAVEDSLVESLTAVFLFAAGAYFLVAAIKRRGGVVMLGVLALVMLIVAGEEISWGQRIFGWTTPDALAGINEQGETTIHNVKGIHGNIRLVALLVLTAFCMILPASRYYVPALKELYDRLGVVIFPVFALPWVGAAFALMIVPRILNEAIEDVGYLDEIGEMALAIAFLLFARTFSSSSRDDAAESTPPQLVPAFEGADDPSRALVAGHEDSAQADLSTTTDNATRP